MYENSQKLNSILNSVGRDFNEKSSLGIYNLICEIDEDYTENLQRNPYYKIYTKNEDFNKALYKASHKKYHKIYKNRYHLEKFMSERICEEVISVLKT